MKHFDGDIVARNKMRTHVKSRPFINFYLRFLKKWHQEPHSYIGNYDHDNNGKIKPGPAISYWMFKDKEGNYIASGNINYVSDVVFKHGAKEALRMLSKISYDSSRISVEIRNSWSVSEYGRGEFARGEVYTFPAKGILLTSETMKQFFGSVKANVTKDGKDVELALVELIDPRAELARHFPWNSAIFSSLLYALNRPAKMFTGLVEAPFSAGKQFFKASRLLAHELREAMYVSPEMSLFEGSAGGIMLGLFFYGGLAVAGVSLLTVAGIGAAPFISTLYQSAASFVSGAASNPTLQYLAGAYAAAKLYSKAIGDKAGAMAEKIGSVKDELLKLVGSMRNF